MALWIVATPIGTLGDLSPRAREVLGSARAIVAEDTRRARQLLGAIGVAAPELVAVHAHNEGGRAQSVARRALEEDIALVTDAGTPGISDPGGQIVAAAHALGVEIRSVPGPSALAAALAASGFLVAPCTFLGFAPRKGRDGWARDALARPEAIAFFEAPSRVIEALAALAAVDPLREACLCRELSKRFEQVVRAPLGALVEQLRAGDPPRGECVVVVGPGAPPSAPPPAALDGGEGLREIAAILAVRWGVSRRDAYQALLRAERAARDEG
jgi:16S rRNA (cytidine1402-2'-O)-methyltransferase